MKSPNDNERQELLERVLWWVLMQSRPLVRWIDDFLKEGGSLWADPGFRIDYVSATHATGHYHVWADSEMSGIESDEATYTIGEVRQMLKKSLLLFAQEYPERAIEVKEVMNKFNL